MARPFAESLAEWTGFYALMGGAAATLLGLQFVALSLRLNIFHRREVADVRDFAAFTFGTFLVAIAISGLALAPHEERGPLALLLFAIGMAGLAGIAWVSRAWVELNRIQFGKREGRGADMLVGGAYLLFMSGAYLGLVAAAILVWREHAAALGWLAIVEAWLIATGTVAAWILLSHAEGEAHDG